MAVKNEGFPDLERYLEERGRHLVTYTEGATMYHIPYYSFVRLAKEAGANTFSKENVVPPLPYSTFSNQSRNAACGARQGLIQC